MKTADQVQAILLKMIAESDELTLEDMELVSIETKPKPDFTGKTELFEMFGYTREQLAQAVIDKVASIQGKKIPILEARYDLYSSEAFRLYSVIMWLSLSETTSVSNLCGNLTDYIMSLPEPVRFITIKAIIGNAKNHYVNFNELLT